jgi:hypothetical protein
MNECRKKGGMTAQRSTHTGALVSVTAGEGATGVGGVGCGTLENEKRNKISGKSM